MNRKTVKWVSLIVAIAFIVTTLSAVIYGLVAGR
jgi:hypothetical protein